jgi:hypothetical protein
VNHPDGEFRRLVYLPDNSIVFDDRVRSSSISSTARAAALQVLGADGGVGSVRTGVELASGKAELRWTAGEGCVLSSVWCDTIVLSALLLSGTRPEAEAEALAMYLASLRRARPVAELNPSNATPLAGFDIPDRPLSCALLIPMVHRKLCDEILAWHAECCAAYLWPH